MRFINKMTDNPRSYMIVDLETEILEAEATARLKGKREGMERAAKIAERKFNRVCYGENVHSCISDLVGSIRRAKEGLK